MLGKTRLERLVLLVSTKCRVPPYLLSTWINSTSTCAAGKTDKCEITAEILFLKQLHPKNGSAPKLLAFLNFLWWRLAIVCEQVLCEQVWPAPHHSSSGSYAGISPFVNSNMVSGITCDFLQGIFEEVPMGMYTVVHKCPGCGLCLRALEDHLWKNECQCNFGHCMGINPISPGSTNQLSCIP
jgi:hypothetical protein